MTKNHVCGGGEIPDKSVREVLEGLYYDKVDYRSNVTVDIALSEITRIIRGAKPKKIPISRETETTGTIENIRMYGHIRNQALDDYEQNLLKSVEGE